MNIFIEGDFPTGKPCEHHCAPTCHPLYRMFGGDHIYGCLHEAWPQNKVGDFCPIVRCNGEFSACEIPVKMLKSMKNGLRRRIKNAWKKMDKCKDEYAALDHLIDRRFQQ